MRQLYLGALTAGAYCCLPLHSALAEGSPPSDPVSVFLAVALLVWLFIAIPYVFIRHRRNKKVIGWTLASYPLAFLLGALFMSDEIRPKPKSDTYEVGSDASYREGDGEGLTREDIYHNMAVIACFETVAWTLAVGVSQSAFETMLKSLKQLEDKQASLAEEAGHVWRDKWTSLLYAHGYSAGSRVLAEGISQFGNDGFEGWAPRVGAKCAGLVRTDKLRQSQDPFDDGTILPPLNTGAAIAMTSLISEFCGEQRSSFKDPLHRARANVAYEECRRAKKLGRELQLDAPTIWKMCINTEPHICYREEVE